MSSSATLQPAVAPAEPEPRQPISGFWRRFAAFLIDGILLAIVGVVLGALLFDQLASLNGWGRLLGLLIETLYFGLQNSSLAGGQTLGKRLLGIRVLDAAGRPISPPVSLVRSFVFFLPWALNQAELPFGGSSPTSFVIVLQSVIIFGLGFLILYLAVFNGRTRQSLHDLIAGTYVVRSGKGSVNAPKIWKGHWAVSGAVLGVMLVAGIVLYEKVAKTPTMQDLIQLEEAIEASGEFHPLNVTKGTTYSAAGNSTYLAVTARIIKPVDPDREKSDLALLILRNNPTALGTDRMVVTLVYGYDLGFATTTRSWRDDKSIEEWRAYLGPRLGPTSGSQPNP